MTISSVGIQITPRRYFKIKRANRIKGMYSIFKTFVLSLLMISQVHFAYAQNAAILPPAMTTFLGPDGKPLAAGKVDFYIPGTTTRKTTWQDADATIPNANPVVLDGSGRALILGNGAYRQVVKDRLNNTIWDRNTSSAGAGGSGSITVGDGNAVGVILPWSGFVAPSNYAFAYGQELNRTTYSTLKDNITLVQNVTCISGNSTLTTVSDTTQLNVGAAVEAACVPAGSTIVSKTANTVTISANATVSVTTSATFFPWGGGNGLTTFNAPDLRGVVLPGRNNMGGSSSVNLTTSFYTDPNSLAGFGGAQSKTLLPTNLPSYTPAGTITFNASNTAIQSAATGGTAAFATANTIGTTGNMQTALAQSATFTGASANGGIAVSATVGAGGSGYTAGTQLLTVSGGTCTTQPQFNVTIAAGAITAPVLVTAGQCSVTPSNPAATTGGGGTAGTLNVIYSAVPFSIIQPSKTINYIVKVSPDVNLSIARCANLIDAGTACTANTGTSGNTIPFLNNANSWSALQTYSAGVAISGGTSSITNLIAPTNSSDAATKGYVDSVATGLNILPQSALATAAVLPNTPTYSNGALGVGATLTAGSNTTLTVDGTVAPLNTVVLVKNQASAFQNGVYTVTTAGSGGAPWVLTRATYFDQAAEMKSGSYTLITSGSTNIGTSWTLQTAVTTVGTDSLTWLQFAAQAGVTSVGGNQGIVTNAQVTASCNLFTGSLSGCVPSGSGTTSISQLNPVTQTWTTPTSVTLDSRATAIGLNLTGVNVLKTMGYATAGDGGGATFIKISGGTQFKDSFITAGSVTFGGVGCTNGTHDGITLDLGTGRGAYATTIVVGGVVTSFTLTAPGNQYSVGDVLTGPIGCSSPWNYTVSAVSAPLASFTDAAGNKFQYMVDAGSVIDPRSFGAKFDCTPLGLTCDATATDDYNSIQASLYFANYHGSKLQTADTPTGYSSRVVMPFGAAKVCVRGTLYNTLVIPDSVVLEGQAKFGSWLKQCDSDDSPDHFVTLGFPFKHIACFGPQLRNMGLYAGISTANNKVAMIYTNCAQQGISINDVAVYTINRMCLRATDGWGGAADFTTNGLFCSVNAGAPNQTEAIEVNYNGANIKLFDVILESGAPYNVRGVSIVNIGGTVNIQNFHAENITLPIWFGAVSPSTVGVTISAITGGVNCVTLVHRQPGTVSGHITLGTAVKAGCTNTYDNAGSVVTTSVYNWVNF